MPADAADPGDDLSRVLTLASAGDDRAWRALLDRYAPRVFAMARSRVGRAELAEEITQSVFAKVAEKMMTGAYTDQGRFESWLFRVAMNRVRDEFRAQKRRPMQSVEGSTLDARPASETESGSMVEPSGEHTALRRAIAQLSDADRTVIELRHHAGLGFKQIAEALGEPAGTVLARHHRALKKLKALIESFSPSPMQERSHEA